jgi:hypothetical protein
LPFGACRVFGELAPAIAINIDLDQHSFATTPIPTIAPTTRRVPTPEEDTRVSQRYRSSTRAAGKMGDVMVENPANHIPPHKKMAPSTIPSIENFEGLPTEGGDDYATLKKLQRQLECVGLVVLPGQSGHGIADADFLQVHPVAGGVHQGRAAEFEERAGAGSGGDKTDPERAARHRPVHGGYRPEVRAYPASLAPARRAQMLTSCC